MRSTCSVNIETQELPMEHQEARTATTTVQSELTLSEVSAGTHRCNKPTMNQEAQLCIPCKRECESEPRERNCEKVTSTGSGNIVPYINVYTAYW